METLEQVQGTRQLPTSTSFPSCLAFVTVEQVWSNYTITLFCLQLGLMTSYTVVIGVAQVKSLP